MPFYQMPHLHLDKLFGTLKERYMTREGGYTRVIRTEPMNTFDQAESAVLEFVDGARDSRFMLTAKAVARDRTLGQDHTDMTRENIEKVTKGRSEAEFEAMVRRYMVKNLKSPQDRMERQTKKADVDMKQVD